jgi:hypothetical protein
MLRKSFFILWVLPFFLVSAVVFAQQSSSQGQNNPNTSPGFTGLQQQSPGQGQFQPGPGSPWYQKPNSGSGGQQLRKPSSNLPGRPGAAPDGTRWTPGHYEEKNGKQMWVPGGYRKIGGGDVVPTPFTPPWFAPKKGENDAASTEQSKGVTSPFSSEHDVKADLPKGIPNSPATEQAISEKLKGHVAKPQGWAVIIGISNYQHAAGKFPELRYAASDAKEYYDFLRTPEGGGISPERILCLENEKATLENIKYAFFEFLKQPLEEDYVLIYFSGHGTPEEDNPENMYLLAYDSRPDRLASTAFPMWDIDTAFSRHIKSKKVLMFADACHSAGIVGDIAMRSINRKNLVNQYLIDVAKTKKGRAVLTASEAGELSQESKKWGGGHGVFSYFLLNGLRGEADVNDDNIVTLGEVTDFVSENVRRATKNTQHPDTGGTFDREFPLASIQP